MALIYSEGVSRIDIENTKTFNYKNSPKQSKVAGLPDVKNSA